MPGRRSWKTSTPNNDDLCRKSRRLRAVLRPASHLPPLIWRFLSPAGRLGGSDHRKSAELCACSVVVASGCRRWSGEAVRLLCDAVVGVIRRLCGFSQIDPLSIRNSVGIFADVDQVDRSVVRHSLVIMFIILAIKQHITVTNISQNILSFPSTKSVKDKSNFYIYIFIHQNGSIKRKKYIHTKIYNKQERKQKWREIRNKQYAQQAITIWQQRQQRREAAGTAGTCL